MANEVCTSLGLTGKDLSGKLLQVVEEHGSNANFVLGSLMWNASKTDSSVCLVALHNTSTHYQNVAKRLGFNLKTAIENKSAFVLEPFKMYAENSQNISDIDMHNEDNLKKLFFDVKKALDSISGKKYLIFDDLSDLLCLGANVAMVAAFLMYCRSLQVTDKNLTLIICTHSSEENENQTVLCNMIAHVADYRVTVAGLKTGFSSNVTGSIEICDSLEDNYTTSVDNKLFHFKLTDRQVKVFAPGTVGIQA